MISIPTAHLSIGFHMSDTIKIRRYGVEPIVPKETNRHCKVAPINELAAILDQQSSR
jgi:hypothetical protein